MQPHQWKTMPADKKKPAILVLREFKFASSAGIWRRTLPMKLTQELSASLQAEPHRKWLFTTNSGIPYTARNFSKWCCAVFYKLICQTPDFNPVETQLSELNGLEQVDNSSPGEFSSSNVSQHRNSRHLQVDCW